MLTVICGFPGVGKSTLTNAANAALVPIHDSDSSKFSWASKGVRHADWPGNYIEHIKSLEGIVFVSTHAEVRAALREAGIPFSVVRPAPAELDRYCCRYTNRGSPQAFVDLLRLKWHAWLGELAAEEVPTFLLSNGLYLADVPFWWFLQAPTYARPIPDPIVIKISDVESITVQGTPPQASLGDTIQRGDDTPAFNGAIDGLTSMITSLHAAGYDISTARFQGVVQEVAEHISNTLGDE